MSNIKKYIIDYDWKASIEIEIDHDVMTEEKLHQINNFWSDSEYRLNKHDSVEWLSIPFSCDSEVHLSSP